VLIGDVRGDKSPNPVAFIEGQSQKRNVYIIIYNIFELKFR